MRTKKNHRVFVAVCIIYLANLIFSSYLYSYSQDTRRILIDTHYKRAIKFYKQRELDKAQEEFEKVIELEPRHRKAQKYIEVIIRKKNKNTIYALYDEAKKLIKAKQYQEALDTYKKVLEIVPKDGYSKFQIEMLEHKVRKINERDHRIRTTREKRKKKLEERALRREMKKIKAERKKSKTVAVLEEQYAEEETIAIQDKKNQHIDKAIKSANMLKDLEIMDKFLDKEKIESEKPQKKEYNFLIQFTKEDQDSEVESAQDLKSQKIDLNELKQLESEMISDTK